MLQTLFNTSVSTTTLYGTVISEIETEKDMDLCSIARFSMRISPSKSSSKTKLTPFVRAFAFGTNAKFIQDRVKNGAPIFLRGKFVKRSKCRSNGEVYRYSEFEIRDVAVIG